MPIHGGNDLRFAMLILVIGLLVAGFVYSIHSGRERGLSLGKSIMDPPEYSKALYSGAGIGMIWVVFWDYMPQKFQGINE